MDGGRGLIFTNVRFKVNALRGVATIFDAITAVFDEYYREGLTN